MVKQSFSGWGKLVIMLCILASLSFLITALVIFIREGDWPARYISAGVTILAVMFVALKRRASRRL